MIRTELLNDSASLRRWRRLLVVSLIVFIGIAVSVMFASPLGTLDEFAAQNMMPQGRSTWTTVMWWLARAHGVAGIAVIGTVWAAYLGSRRQTAQLLELGWVVGGGLALNGLLKLVFQRERPVFDGGVEAPLQLLSTYSFPSGHVSGSVVFYGYALMLVFTRTAHRGWRFAAAVGAAFMVALIAYNRLYVGAHFVSDVLAAIAEGLAWLAFCALLLARLRRQSSA